MNIEKIINSFPECEKVKKEDIAAIIKKTLSEAKTYHEIYNNIMKSLETLYPRVKNETKEDKQIRCDYLYGSGYDDNWNYIHPLGDWIKNIEDEFIKENGNVHTFEEAVDIAAKKWVDLIFGYHIQDNGAINESHGGGFPACALGTILKNSTIEKMENKEKIATKTYELIKKFYIDTKNNKSYYLSVDYGPNTYLDDILIKAGVDENKTSNICPWKTMIKIDKKDNSVCYHTYGNVDYI